MSATIEKSKQQVSYGQLLRFFVPLGITPSLIGSTHSLVNAAMGRLPLPEVSLAIFTVVQGFTNAVKAPDLAAQQSTIALVDGERSYRRVMGFLWALCALLVGALLLLAYTPAGGWVFRRLLGLSDPVHIEYAYSSLRVVCFLPIVETARNAYNGIAIARKHTVVLPLSTAVRILFLLAFLAWAVSTQAVTGAIAASLTWLGGIGIEALVVIGFLFAKYGSLSGAARRVGKGSGATLRLVEVIRFFAPLGLVMTLSAALQPVIQGGLARAEAPTQTLAAYGVAWGLVVILSGPLRSLHQAALVFTSDFADPNWPKVRRFCLAVGVATSSALLGLTATPLGAWLLGTLMAVPESIVDLTASTLSAFALYPLVQAVREGYWGVMMRRRSTGMIAAAKIGNLLAVLAAVLLGLGPLKPDLPPPVLGAVAFTVGEGIETAIIIGHGRGIGRWRSPAHGAKL